VAVAGVLTAAADAPTGGEPNVRAYVLSNVYLAQPDEPNICKTVSDGGLEIYLKSLPSEEQAKYATPDKRPALERRMDKEFGFRRVAIAARDPRFAAKLPASYKPGDPATPELALAIGELNGFPKGRGRLAFSKQTVAYSSCTNPEDFPMLAKGFRTYEGKVAAGMDLDGKAGKEDFVSPDGAKGVDNQLFRAVGCVKPFIESSQSNVSKTVMISARAPTLIEIRDVQDPKNDPDVTVRILAATNPIIKDARGQALARATFAPERDSTLQATTKGRIVDGVLTTDPVDLVLNYKEQIVDAPRHFRGARLRAELKPDGGIEGTLYGYYTLASYYDSIEQMTQNGANLTGVSCPGVRQAIDKLADGYRDPKSGRFTAISSAFNFHGVRAFVTDTQPQQRVADLNR
jgi:hypothetical protein